LQRQLYGKLELGTEEYSVFHWCGRGPSVDRRERKQEHKEEVSNSQSQCP